MEKRQILKSEKETLALGARVARMLRVGDCVILSGNLGAGKTCLARGIVQALTSVSENVPSPTFTLVQTYDSVPPLWHVDCYRLEKVEEITELGLLEALDDSALVIEWADKIKHLLPLVRLEIHLSVPGGDFARREARLVGLGVRWEREINGL